MGKVHGGLANAGKVRGQTPRVEPEEKPKKKTGRRRMREKYNRRFTVVSSTPGNVVYKDTGKGGKGRGPNAQSIGVKK